jgi:hypothetical protein
VDEPGVTTTEPGPKKGKPSGDDVGKPLSDDDLATRYGMPKENVDAIRGVCEAEGVIVDVRPTTPYAEPLLREGKALPKPEKVKAKTINDVDVMIGLGKESDLGKVGFFDPTKIEPKRPANFDELDPKTQKKIDDRIKQRKEEFAEYKKDMDKLVAEGKIRIEPDGTVVNTGLIPGGEKPFTGDHDIFDIRAKDGTPLSPERYQEVVGKLKEAKVTTEAGEASAGVMHGAVTGWELDAPETFHTPAGQKAYDKMISAHSAGGDEPLVRFGAGDPHATWYEPVGPKPGSGEPFSQADIDHWAANMEKNLPGANPEGATLHQIEAIKGPEAPGPDLREFEPLPGPKPGGGETPAAATPGGTPETGPAPGEPGGPSPSAKVPEGGADIGGRDGNAPQITNLAPERMSSGGFAGSIEDHPLLGVRKAEHPTAGPVVVKSYPDTPVYREMMANEMKVGAIAEQAGVGVPMHGEVKMPELDPGHPVTARTGERLPDGSPVRVETDVIGFAMGEAPGGFFEAHGMADTPAGRAEMREHALNINEQSYRDVEAFRDALSENGYIVQGDLQGFVGPDGKWRPIDTQPYRNATAPDPRSGYEPMTPEEIKAHNKERFDEYMDTMRDEHRRAVENDYEPLDEDVEPPTQRRPAAEQQPVAEPEVEAEPPTVRNPMPGEPARPADDLDLEPEPPTVRRPAVEEEPPTVRQPRTTGADEWDEPTVEIPAVRARTTTAEMPRVEVDVEGVTVHGHDAPVPGPHTLTPAELAELQAIADQFGTELHVTGSRGRGQGRGVETDLPPGKGDGTKSDIDVIIDGDVDIRTSGRLSNTVSGACSGVANVASSTGMVWGPHITIRPRRR